MAGNRGFTLIEIILVIALVAGLLALGLFVSLDVYRGYTYRSERATVVALLTRARSHAMANIDGAPWGVCTQSGAYKLFHGATYAAGAVEESVMAASAAEVSGLPECGAGAIVFTQLSGTTTAATITVKQTGGDATIDINDQGTIIW